MTNVLLITDVPRLMKIFSRLADDANIRLRMVNNLESGGEEIVADKPAIIFVQAHLSGLSADILFKHLKKQLGKKRSRFVLLCSSEQTTEEAIVNYHGHIDTSMDDLSLSAAISDWIANLGVKLKPAHPDSETVAIASQQHRKIIPEASDESSPLQENVKIAMQVSNADSGDSSRISYPATPQADPQVPFTLQSIPDRKGDSLEDLGVTYTARPRISVQSRFTNSFDSAIKESEPPEPVSKPQSVQSRAWAYDEMEVFDTPPARSKIATFLLWLVPVLVIVVIVTMFQQRKPQTSAKVEVAPAKLVPANIPAKQAASSTQVDNNKPASAPQATVTNKPATAQVAPENSSPKVSAPSALRLKELPDFIPRDGFDKSFGAANPGWERYKGHSTEFKLYREGEFIKAIQIIDRSGKGVPDSFIKAVLKQVSKNPNFVLGTSEKKEGYEIQRGQLGDGVKLVYYRDEQVGTIRALVLTWP